MQSSKWWLDFSKRIWCGAASTFKIKKKGLKRGINSNWYWEHNACWNWRSSYMSQGPSANPASRCSSWACLCCTGNQRFKLSHWRCPSVPSSLWQCARMVTIVRAQHKSSVLLMVQDNGFTDRKTLDVPGAGIRGGDSGDGQVRGMIDCRKIRGGPPHGYRFFHPRQAWTEHYDWRTRR